MLKRRASAQFSQKRKHVVKPKKLYVRAQTDMTLKHEADRRGTSYNQLVSDLLDAAAASFLQAAQAG